MKEHTQKPWYSWLRLWWVRALAFFLALLMVATALLSIAIGIRLQPDGSAPESALGATTGYVAKGPVERAGDYLSQLFSDPQTLDEHYLNASILIGAARYAEALASINTCLALCDAANKELLYELWLKRGCLETLTGAPDKALSSFKNIPEGVYDADVLLIKAQIYDEMGDAGMAAHMLETYVEKFPDDMDTRLLLAEAYIRLESYEAAVSQYDFIIDSEGDRQGTVLMLRASARMLAGLYAGAIKDFLAAKDAGYADPSACYAQSALASYLEQDYDSALSYGGQAIELGSPNFTYETLYYYMGLSRMELGEFEDAIALLTEAIQAGFTAADAHYYRGVCHMVIGSMKQAVADFTVAIDRKVEGLLSSSYFNRGVCAADINDDEMAKNDFEMVMRLERQGDLYDSAHTMLQLLK